MTTSCSETHEKAGQQVDAADNLDAAQSVLRPLCLLPGFTAEPHLVPANRIQPREMNDGPRCVVRAQCPRWGEEVRLTRDKKGDEWPLLAALMASNARHA